VTRLRAIILNDRVLQTMLRELDAVNPGTRSDAT